MIVLMPGHQTDASIIKVTMKEPLINNSKAFKIDEKLTLFFGRIEGHLLLNFI